MRRFRLSPFAGALFDRRTMQDHYNTAGQLQLEVTKFRQCQFWII